MSQENELILLRQLAKAAYAYKKHRMHPDRLLVFGLAKVWYDNYEKERLKKGEHKHGDIDKAT